ncbi:MAG: acyl-CoA dehydrogenase family protein [Chloroflexi bacterium]|nr:acyl-CoA dehydrogenase family protein [Chloroflexota bacterium]
MLDFSLNQEQLEAARMVREFGENEIYPTIKEYDRKQEMNPAALPRMAELGILGINIPVRYGGQGFDYVTLGLVCEETGAGRYHFARGYVCAYGLEQHGHPAMGQRSAKAALSHPAGAG